jgi:hypothetical protein
VTVVSVQVDKEHELMMYDDYDQQVVKYLQM